MKNSCSVVRSPWKMFPSVSPYVRSRSSGVRTWAASTVAPVDTGDGRVGADLRAKPLRGIGHRAGDRAHSADHVPVEALDVVVAARQKVEQQSDRGPRLVRPAVLAVHVVRQVQRLDL